jgi:RND family efflux transporter MFP subunit
MSPAECPNRSTLFDYLVGKLPEEASDALADHVEACPGCQAELATLSDVEDTLVGQIRGVAAPEPYLDESECGRAIAMAKAASNVAGREASAAAREMGTVPFSPEVSETSLSIQLGEYRLIERLGTGGMGAVYKALHSKLDRVVALKILPPSRTEDQRAIDRFEREMKAIGRLDHPHIVRAHDAREIEGRLVLVMEFVEGLDLGKIVRRLGRIEPADACEIGRQAALGLQAAHEHGMVHRDVKPSNLMLTPEGSVKLLDLGLARLYREPSVEDDMTGTGQAMGTADYMAPEQTSDSRAVDIRADVYSLGATLYKLLSGRAPFSGPEYQSAFEKMLAHRQAPPPAITQFCPEMPEGLVAVLDRMLAKDPAARHQTPTEAAEALAPFCDGAELPQLLQRAISSPLPQGEGQGEGRSAGVSPALSGRSRATNASQAPSGQDALAPAARRWRTLVAALVALLLVGGLGFAAGIMIRIHKDGKVTNVEIAEGNNASIDAKGNLDVTPAGGTLSGKTPPSADSAPAATPPGESPLTFGPVIERVLNLPGQGKGSEAIDLTNGKLVDLPKDFDKWAAEKQYRWCADNNVDLVLCLHGGAGESQLAFLAERLKLAAIGNYELWDGITRQTLDSAFASAATDSSVVHERRGAAYHWIFDVPFMFVIQTRKGNLGLLQGIRYVQEPSGLRIRYKLVQPPVKSAQERGGPEDPLIAATPSEPPVKFHAEIERVINFAGKGTGIDAVDVDRGFGVTLPAGFTKLPMVDRDKLMESDNVSFFFTDQPQLAMVSHGLRLQSIPAEAWDGISKRKLQAAIRLSGPPEAYVHWPLPEEYSEPLVFAFQTHKGHLGLLQILGYTDEGVRIRYKLAQLKTAPPQVSVSRPVIREISDSFDFTGTIQAAKSVDIRARVTGNLDKAFFNAGAKVKQGELLFEIDPRQYLAAVEKSQLDLQLAELRLKSAATEFDRVKKLRANNSIAETDFERIEGRYNEAKLALQAALNDLKLTKTNLDYTKVKAPIDGHIVSMRATVGSLVAGETTELATIDSDAMRVLFTVDERTLLELRRRAAEERAKTGRDLEMLLQCGVGSETDFPRRGKLESIDVRISGGRAVLCAALPNADGALIPGLAARLRLTLGSPHKALLVPERAIGNDQGTSFVLVVNSKNTTERRNVKLGHCVGDLRVVTDGLTADDRIVDSTQADVSAGTIIEPEREVGTTPPPSAASAQPASPTADLKALQGQWRVVRVEKGKDASDDWGPIFDFSLTLDPAAVDRIEFRKVDDTWMLRVRQLVKVAGVGSVPLVPGGWLNDTEYRIDPMANPKTIDIVDREHTIPNALGIYSIEGDQLKICLSRYVPALQASQRPGRFAADANSNQVLLVLERYRPTAEENAVRETAKVVEGWWTPIEQVDDGEPVGAEQLRHTVYSIGDDVITGHNTDSNGYLNSNWSFKGYVLDTSATPKRITLIQSDYTPETPAGREPRWTPLPGIYKRDGERLTIAYRKGDKPPEAFESKAGSGVSFLVLRKTQEPKQPPPPFGGGGMGGMAGSMPGMGGMGGGMGGMAAASQGRPINAAAELKALQGLWKIVRTEKGEAAESPWETLFGPGGSNTTTRMFFEETSVDVVCAERENTSQLPYEITPTSMPKTIDFRVSKNGNQALGIYEIVNGQLRICMARARSAVNAEQRPANFQVDPKSGNVLLVLERCPMHPIEGRWWKVVSVERGSGYDAKGPSLYAFQSPPGPEALYRFDFRLGGPQGDGLWLHWFDPQRERDWGSEQLTCRADPTVTPKTIDLLSGGPRAMGIYEMDGDRMTLCLRRASPMTTADPRPKKLVITPDSEDLLIVLRRDRPSEDQERLCSGWGVVSRIEDGKSTALSENVNDKAFGISDMSFQLYGESVGQLFGLNVNAGARALNMPYVVDETKQPKRITVFGYESQNPDSDGGIKSTRRDLIGIYKFEGKRLIMAFGKGDKPPQGFESQPGSGVTLLTCVSLRSTAGVGPGGPMMPNMPGGMPGGMPGMMPGGMRGPMPGGGMPRGMPGGFPATPPRPKPVKFRTAAVTRGDLELTTNVTGTVQVEEVRNVTALVSGQIVALGEDPRGKTDPAFRRKSVDYQTPVEVGTLLVKLDDVTYSTRLDQEKAAVRRAKAELEVATAKAKVMDQVTRASIAAAEAAVEQNMAAEKLAAINLERTSIRSPLKGVIVSSRAMIGQMVDTDPKSLPLFMLAADVKVARIWATVSGPNLRQVGKGMAAKVVNPKRPKDVFKGTVVSIQPDPKSAGSAGSTVEVTVENPDFKLKPYMEVNLTISGTEKALFVPASALEWKPQTHQIGQPVPRAARDYLTATYVLWVKANDGIHVQPSFVLVLGKRGDQVAVANRGGQAALGGTDVKEGTEVVTGEEDAARAR